MAEWPWSSTRAHCPSDMATHAPRGPPMAEQDVKAPKKTLKLPESGTAEEILALLGQTLPTSSEQILEFADLTSTLTHDAAAPKVERIALLVFQLQSESYAIPLNQVIEILR